MLPKPFFTGGSAEAGGMHSAPIPAPTSTGRALHRVRWARTIAGYILDAIEPTYMFMLIGLALVWRSRSRHKDFVVLASIARALMAVRHLGNATIAWTVAGGPDGAKLDEGVATSGVCRVRPDSPWRVSTMHGVQPACSGR